MTPRPSAAAPVWGGGVPVMLRTPALFPPRPNRYTEDPPWTALNPAR